MYFYRGQPRPYYKGRPQRQWRNQEFMLGGAHVSLPSPPLPSPPLPLEVGPQIQLGGLGERCKLPQRGLGRSRNRLWCIFSLKIRHLVATILRIFVRVN